MNDETPPNKPDTRTRILRAARDIFSENGYDRSTTRLIANEANVNEVTLFRHFGNKEKLFMSVVNEYSAVFNLSQVSKIELSGEPYDDLLVLGKILYQSLTERHNEVLTLLCESKRNDFIKDVMVKIPQQLQGIYGAFFENHIESGNFKEKEPRLLATAFMGMFFSLTIFKNFLGGAISDHISGEQIVEQYVNIFFNGVRKDQTYLNKDDQHE